MVRVDWNKVENCPECGSSQIDLESEDTIETNYYIYCLQCRHAGVTAKGKWIDRATVVETAVKNWNNEDR